MKSGIDGFRGRGICWLFVRGLFFGKNVRMLLFNDGVKFKNG